MLTTQTKKHAHSLKKTGQIARWQQMGTFAAIIQQNNFKPLAMKIETFKTITEAINYVLDNNLYYINLSKFEQELMDKHIFKSKIYNIIFLIKQN